MTLHAGDDLADLSRIDDDAARRRRAPQSYLSANARGAYEGEHRHPATAPGAGCHVQLVNLGQQPCPGLPARVRADLAVQWPALEGRMA